MTIPNTARKAGPLLGTGSQTAWPFTFKVFAAGDVQVTIANSAGTETLLVLGTDYSVTLNSNQETSPGGTVNYPISGAALPVGSVLAIIGDLDYDQPLDLPSGGNFSPTALENQLDRSTMQIQQLREEMNRTAKLPPTSTESVEALVDDLQRIADSADNLDTVADNIADINTVADDLNEPVSEINTVAGAIANVNAVGSNITNVNTVAGISANVTTVAGIAANVTAVAAIDDDVTAVAGVAAAVTAVAAIDDDVAIAAANVADITNFADVYQGAKTSDPALRNDGSALQAGDLYFNTVEQALRTYGGTQWVAGTAGTMVVQNFSGNGSTTAFTLTTAPASENNTQVYIGGVYQQKDQYSVSGTTLTFGTAPVSGTNNIEVVTISTLALGETDASLVAFVQAGAGAVERTVQNKLREGASLKDFDGVGDGVTSDQTAVANAIASGFESVLVNDDARFLVTSLTNIRGVEFDGHGHIVKAITGGLQKLNSYGDKHKYVFGLEYMAAFHKLLITQHTTPTRKPIMVFSGDSTTAGDGVDVDYQIDDLIKRAGEVAGVQTPYGLSSINRGQSGANTEQWRTTHLAGDLAANPDLLVLRWGINDPGWLKNGSPPPLDAGQDYPNRRDVGDFLTSLRSGLATIRASRSLSSLSIVLMSPNSTADTPNGRDELWYEQIIPGIKQAARDYQCAFIDTYAYLRDSRPAATIWMDNPFGDGRGIHPLNVMNTWIAGLMSSVIFPDGLRQKIGRANVRNIGGAESTPASTLLPSTYEYGLSINRASGSAWIFDGSVVTIRSQDEIVIQINSPYQTSATSRRFAYRMGRAVTLGGFAPGWEPWQILGESSASVSPASGYTSSGMRTVINGSIVVADGYITKSTAATIPANTTVGTVAVGYRPVNDAFYGIATIYSGGSFETVRCRVNPTGELVLIQATTLSAERVYLNASWSNYS